MEAIFDFKAIARRARLADTRPQSVVQFPITVEIPQSRPPADVRFEEIWPYPASEDFTRWLIDDQFKLMKELAASAGSDVPPAGALSPCAQSAEQDRLRFDYTHTRPQSMEAAAVRANGLVKLNEMTIVQQPSSIDYGALVWSDYEGRYVPNPKHPCAKHALVNCAVCRIAASDGA